MTVERSGVTVGRRLPLFAGVGMPSRGGATHGIRASILAALIACGCAEEVNDAPLPLGDSAADCGGCHEDHFEQFRSSPHATSARSPIFQAMLPDVERAWGGAARAQCEGCHAPAHSSDEGIGCLSCHAAVGNHAERDGMLAVDPSAPLAGSLRDAAPSVAHRTRQSDFLTSPSLCGTCHELTGPALVDEPTLSEYRASPQAAGGVTCAGCHMPDDGERPLTNDPDARPRSTRSHRFVGFDPPWGAGPEEAAAAAERTRALLASALTLEVVRVEGGVEIALSNTGAGHAVPTGATFLRDLWVDVVIDGVTGPRVIVLGDQPMHGEREVALLTHAERVERGSLDAGAERRVFLPAPPSASITATLRGRAIRDSVLAALALEARAGEIPTHEIASASARSGREN